MAFGTSKSSVKTTRSSRLEEWAALRSELRIPGYWDTLSQNCAQWANEVDVCAFWSNFKKHRSAWSNEFHQKTGGALLARDQHPTFCGKAHERIQTKITRLTSGKVAQDSTEIWPTEGPPVPQLNDLVRTRVECQFVDGVEFIGSKLENLAEEMGIRVNRERQGRLEGYFAQHLYFDHEVLFSFGGTVQQVTIQCEVQIATQLATRIWYESHGVYEQWRGRKETQEEWQWNPKDPRFIARQLGHMIHLADGLLVQLRDAHSAERM